MLKRFAYMLHWSKSLNLLHTPTIAKATTHSKFEDILTCIHLVDDNNVVINKDDLTYDKIVKTRWLVEIHNELCEDAKQNLCVDEMMV
jgi:hypothetical protein